MMAKQWLLGLMLIPALFASVGCIKALDKYYTAPKHFRFGTAKVRQMDKPLDRAYEGCLAVLESHDWGVAKKEMEDNKALIRARKAERELIFDIKSEGDVSEIRVEMDQDGNDGELWALLNELDMLP